MSTRGNNTSVAKLAGPNSRIFDNAVRLLEDARILRKARRYPSSAALAILSLEELGKFLINCEQFSEEIRPLPPPKKNRPYTHKQKQRLAGEALVWAMYSIDITKMALAQGYKRMYLRPGEGPTAADIVESIDEKTYSKIAKALIHKEHNKYVVELLNGKFDALKQSCLYVDMEGAKKSPNQIDRLTADRMLRLASGAIYSTKQVIRYASALKRHASREQAHSP
jgi:AbiV family abortive infection protein